MVKKGDTLIEVTIAIGIFSMIAVAIVAVMSNGSAGAQTALETTLAREEIDTQAEALRFIHSAYAVNTNSTESNKYAALWNKITDNAVVLSSSSTEEFQTSVLQYRPTQCSELYDSVGSTYFNNAFVINTKALGTFDAKTVDTVYKASNASGTGSVPFGQAVTYPRLVYSQDNQDSLVGNTGGALTSVEGLFVVAVKDSNTTTVVDEKGSNKTSTFYDFFIRSCWYGSNADEPSTISTVIRLYDPNF